MYDVSLTLRPMKKVTRIYLAPTGEALPYTEENGAITLTVPKIECHQMVVLDYQK